MAWAMVSAPVTVRQYRSAPIRAKMNSRPVWSETAAGEELKPLIAALQQWGDEHVPAPDGPTVLWRHRVTGEPVGVAFVDPRGHLVDREDAVFERTAAYPG